MDSIESTRVMAVVLAVFALIVAACGSSETTDRTATTTSTVAAPEEDDSTASDDEPDVIDDVPAASALGDPNPAAGDPVKIGLGTSVGSEALQADGERMLAGASVAVQYINEYRGGIGGRPIELFTCGLGILTETAIDCANQFVEQDVAAVIVPASTNGGSVVPIVTGAGIAYVTAGAASPEELTSPGAFSITGGAVGALGVIAADAEQRGFSTLSHVVIDVPQATVITAGVVDPLWGAAGITQQVILVPPGTPDLIAQLSTGTGDAIVLTLDAASCASALQAYRTLALDTPLYLLSPCVTDEIKSALPGIYANASVAAVGGSDPQEAELLAAMIERYDPDNPISRDIVGSGIYGGTVSTIVSFVDALDGLTSLSAADIHTKLAAGGEVSLFLGSPATFSCDAPPVAIAPALCAVSGHLATLDADGAVASSQYFDPVDLYAAAFDG